MSKHTDTSRSRADIVARSLGIVTLGNKVRVTDPCYNRNDHHNGVATLDVLPGRWVVEMDVVREDGKPWNLVITHEDHIRRYRSLQFYTPAYGIYVDSGQVGFFDDHYHAQIVPTEDLSPFDHPPFGAFYDDCCERTLDENHGGIIKGGWGAVSGTYYGDGVYPLTIAHAHRDRTGPIVAAFVNYEYGDTE